MKQLETKLIRLIPNKLHRGIRTEFPKEYCPKHDERTIHYRGKCLRCEYDKE